jgi:hypothetical protein
MRTCYHIRLSNLKPYANAKDKSIFENANLIAIGSSIYIFPPKFLRKVLKFIVEDSEWLGTIAHCAKPVTG